MVLVTNNTSYYFKVVLQFYTKGSVTSFIQLLEVFWMFTRNILIMYSFVSNPHVLIQILQWIIQFVQGIRMQQKLDIFLKKELPVKTLSQFFKPLTNSDTVNL